MKYHRHCILPNSLILVVHIRSAAFINRDIVHVSLEVLESIYKPDGNPVWCSPNWSIGKFLVPHFVHRTSKKTLGKAKCYLVPWLELKEEQMSVTNIEKKPSNFQVESPFFNLRV